MNITVRPIFRTRPILLGGVSVYESLHTPEATMGIRIVKFIYDEASDANTGVDIRIGKIGDPDYFATYTTEVSKSAGDITIIGQITKTLAKDETLTVECDGGKVGDGTVSVQIECYNDYILFNN